MYSGGLATMTFFTLTLRHFGRRQDGSIMILAAMLFPMLMAAAGAAIDLGTAESERSNVQSSLDSAIIMGVSAASSSLKNGSTSGTAISAAEAAAAKYLQSTIGNSASSSLKFTIADGVVKGVGSASTSVPTTFMALFGKSSVAVSATSTAEAGLSEYLNVYLLVDISASMLLPSTEAGITAMRNGTGCALACHDSSSGNDTYNWALNKGIQLRYQVVNSGINNLLTYLQSDSAYASKVKVGLWAFDHKITSYSALTSNFKNVAKKFPGPSLASDEASAATTFDTSIPSFIKTVGKGGDGTTAKSPRKLVIIATDGVNDPTRAWTWNTSLRTQVRVFNTSFCNTFESNGVTVAMIYTPYFPMPWDWGYNATLGQPGSLGGATRVDDIPIALKQCAGDNYVQASDVSAIESSFTSIFKNTSPIRVTN